MTLPTDAVDRARTWFAEMRKLTQYRSATDRVCDAEEAFVVLLERELRTPTGIALPDGFPAGGNGGTRGGATSTTTEAAALADQPHEDGTPPRIDIDTIGPLVLTAYDFTVQGGMSARTVRARITEATEATRQRKRHSHTNEMCSTVGGDLAYQEIPCGEIAIAKGLCRQCYDALRNLNDTRAKNGQPPIPGLSKAEADKVFAKRTKKRTYETGPFAEEAV